MRRELDDDRAVIVVEGGGGVGPFLWGLVAGAVLAFLLAPQTGAETRAHLKRKWGDLRTLAEEKADDLRDLVSGDEREDDAQAADREPEDSTPRGGGASRKRTGTRADLERRLAEARKARRGGGGGGGGGGAASPKVAPTDEDEEPVA